MSKLISRNTLYGSMENFFRHDNIIIVNKHALYIYIYIHIPFKNERVITFGC